VIDTEYHVVSGNLSAKDLSTATTETPELVATNGHGIDTVLAPPAK
jgi:uncharacterized surface protein with fasciclin (FAS1) repeats